MGEIVQDTARVADGLEAVKARLEDFGREVMAGAVNRPGAGGQWWLVSARAA
jgi:hypothetical protein